MKRFTGLASITLSLFLFSCASPQKRIITPNGYTFARLPANSGIIHWFKQLVKDSNQVDEVLELVNKNKKFLVHDESIPDIKTLDELGQYSSAVEYLARIIDDNDGKIIWKGFNINLASKWEKYVDEKSFMHSAVIAKKVNVSKNGFGAGSITRYIDPKNAKALANPDEIKMINKILDKAVKSEIIPALEAKNIAKNVLDNLDANELNATVFVQYINQHVDILHKTNGRMGFLDASSICPTFAKDPREGMKLVQASTSIGALLDSGVYRVPSNEAEFVTLFARGGDSHINPSRVLDDITDDSDEFVKVLDEYKWRKNGLCASECKSLHAKACRL